MVVTYIFFFDQPLRGMSIELYSNLLIWKVYVYSSLPPLYLHWMSTIYYYRVQLQFLLEWINKFRFSISLRDLHVFEIWSWRKYLSQLGSENSWNVSQDWSVQ